MSRRPTIPGHHVALPDDRPESGLSDHPAPERAADRVFDEEVYDRVHARWVTLTQQQRIDETYERAAAAGCDYCGSTNCRGYCPQVNEP
jgi:hypothetical protein